MIGARILILNHYGYYGGTLVLSCLCKTLRELGYDAKLFMCEEIPGHEVNPKDFIKYNVKRNLRLKKEEFKQRIKSFIPFKQNRFEKDTSSTDMTGLSFKWSANIDTDNTIIIYPEITYSNPLGGKHIVRWLLSNRFPQIQESRGEDDIYICYRQFFNDVKLNPKGYEVQLNYFDSVLYHQYNFGERKGKCYILRTKGHARSDLPEKFDGPVFDNNMSQKDLVKLFNQCKYCYSYDTQTFYTVIAAVCGCIPIVVLEDGKTEKDYLGENEHDHYGVAYGDSPEQIEYAINTREKLIKTLDYSESNKKNAMILVKLLEDRFGKIRRI